MDRKDHLGEPVTRRPWRPVAAAALGLGLALLAAPAGAQEEPPSRPDGPSTSPTENAPDSSSLTDEDRETLESLRFVLADEGRDVAREALREIVDGLAEPPSGEEASHLAFLLELDRLADELGSLQESKRLCESVLEIRTRLLPADHPALVEAKQSLGATLARLGEMARARELFEAVLEARTRLLPADHPDLLSAQTNIALARYLSGDLTGAIELEEHVLEAQTRLLPADDPEVLRAKASLALMKKDGGDLSGARELEEAVLEVVLHEAGADLVEGAADGHGLGEHVLALAALLEHALEAAGLALDASKAGHDGVLEGLRGGGLGGGGGHVRFLGALYFLQLDIPLGGILECR